MTVPAWGGEASAAALLAVVVAEIVLTARPGRGSFTARSTGSPRWSRSARAAGCADCYSTPGSRPTGAPATCAAWARIRQTSRRSSAAMATSTTPPGLSGLIGRLGRANLPVLIHPEFWARRRLAIPGRAVRAAHH